MASPMSEDRRYVRNSLLPSLLGCIAYNQARNQHDVALFEISNVYGNHHVEERLAVAASGALQKNRWQKFSVDVDFYTLKGLAESMLEALGFSNNRISVQENKLDTKHFHPYRSGLVGGIEDMGEFDRMISSTDETEPVVDELPSMVSRKIRRTTAAASSSIYQLYLSPGIFL